MSGVAINEQGSAFAASVLKKLNKDAKLKAPAEAPAATTARPARFDPVAAERR